MKASITQAGQPSVGSPVLTASGYLVARRKAVVSAKIQGRLAEPARRGGQPRARGRGHRAAGERRLRGAGAAGARASSSGPRPTSRRASGRRASPRASPERTCCPATRSKRREPRAHRRGRRRAGQRGPRLRAGAAAEHARSARRSPATVVKKMAEVGESVAPIPPGVNLSTSSGAIVALADLDTLEMEADVSRGQRGAARRRPAGRGRPSRRSRTSTYRAVLRQVIPTADRTKATVQVKVTLLDKDPKPEAGDERQGDVPGARARKAAAARAGGAGR